MKHQVFNRRVVSVVLLLVCVISIPSSVLAQAAQDNITLKQVQWKSEQQIRDLMGEPTSIKGPVGTHASYILWHYPDVTVAFANKRVFHLFRKDSLHKLELN